MSAQFARSLAAPSTTGRLASPLLFGTAAHLCPWLPEHDEFLASTPQAPERRPLQPIRSPPESSPVKSDDGAGSRRHEAPQSAVARLRALPPRLAKSTAHVCVRRTSPTWRSRSTLGTVTNMPGTSPDRASALSVWSSTSTTVKACAAWCAHRALRRLRRPPQSPALRHPRMQRPRPRRLHLGRTPCCSDSWARCRTVLRSADHSGSRRRCCTSRGRAAVPGQTLTQTPKGLLP